MCFQHSSPSTLGPCYKLFSRFISCVVHHLHLLRSRPDSCCSFGLVAGGGGAFGGLLLLSSVTVVFSPPFNPLSHALHWHPLPQTTCLERHALCNQHRHACESKDNNSSSPHKHTHSTHSLFHTVWFVYTVRM